MHHWTELVEVITNVIKKNTLVLAKDIGKMLVQLPWKRKGTLNWYSIIAEQLQSGE